MGYFRVIVEEGFRGKKEGGPSPRHWGRYAEDFSGMEEEAIEEGKVILLSQGVEDVEEYLKSYPMVIRVEKTIPHF